MGARATWICARATRRVARASDVCKGHIFCLYTKILMINSIIWCKGLNQRCKGLSCVQGPHILPFYLITNDNQCRESLHCSLAPCSLGESTVSDRALIFPTPLLSQLQGWPGCQKIIFFFLQINLFSFCARIEPKLSKLQKTVKIDKRSSKKPCFLIVFRIFSILGSILAQKTTKSKYLSIVPFICHPGHP